ncbi:MAG: hypothetical protein KC503_00350 [Myxococcales bacterium]|nr:hypothetical protein [Myxococcales bacterium]
MTTPTPTDLELRCHCGGVQLLAANVTPAVANRIVCHCAGCRAFAERMDARDLDALGGVERMQVSPAALHITRGADALACMQQSPRGALRWIARCCGTPLGLTLRSARVPFVGLDVKRVDLDRLVRPLDDVIGPLRARVNGTFARSERPALRADTRSLLSMLAHLAPLTLRWWWRGDQRRSPFFDKGRPVVEVETLYEAREPKLLGRGCR